MDSGRRDSAGWAVVLPVKRLERAKTRLAVAPAARAELALAMALDVASAALEARTVRAVLAVTDDPRAAAELQRLGAEVEPDRPDAGLNPALSHGARTARDRYGDCGVALVSSDVAGVTAVELDRVTDAATAHRRSFVADAAGGGTAALLARAGVAPEPAFGPGSARRHEAGGAVRLDVEAPGLRRDVDDLASLWRLLEDAGGAVAPRTRALAAELSGGSGLTSRGMTAAAGSRQATVRRFDAEAGTGEVLLDDGHTLHFAASALAGSGVRGLRVGQRVRLTLDADGHVERLTLATLSL